MNSMQRVQNMNPARRELYNHYLQQALTTPLSSAQQPATNMTATATNMTATATNMTATAAKVPSPAVAKMGFLERVGNDLVAGVVNKIKSEFTALDPIDKLAAALAKLGASFAGFGDEIAKMLEKAAKECADNPQKFFNEKGKFLLTNILPKYAFWTAVVTGVPLTINYIYLTYVHSIGRPRLAVRERRVEGLRAKFSSKVHRFAMQMLGMKVPEKMAPVFNKETQRRIEDFAKGITATIKNKGFHSGMALYGPPGVGKTMVIEKIAEDADVNFLMMSGGTLPQFIKRGEHVTELNKMFDAAEESTQPTIIFIDEAEAFCIDRTRFPHLQTPERMDLLTAFLNRTGTPSKKVIVILATNCIDMLDPAVRSRMADEIEIPLPGKEERKPMIAQYLPQFFDANTIKTVFTAPILDKVAGATEGFSGRDIFYLLNSMLRKKTSAQDNKLTSDMVGQTVLDYAMQMKKRMSQAAAVGHTAPAA